MVRGVWQRDVGAGERAHTDAAAARHLAGEELLQVRSQDDDIVRAVDAPAIDGTLQQSVKLRPLRLRAGLARLIDDVRPAAKVSEGKLVKLGPSLWHVRAALLHHRVEPGEEKEQLGAQRRSFGNILR